MKLTIVESPKPLSRVKPATREPLRVALVQMRWQEDQSAYQAKLAEGIAKAASAGAKIVFLPELTLSRYPADEMPTGPVLPLAEDLIDGPTHQFAATAAKANNVYVHASKIH
jgi:N-carbamoylputrescine amidase